jgi:RNA polymerase sigma-70 factor (ECF subfamily)
MPLRSCRPFRCPREVRLGEAQEGAEKVARRALAASQLGLVARPALINGAAGWVSVLDAELFAIGALTVHNGRITRMDILLDPARLARLDLTAFDPRL